MEITFFVEGDPKGQPRPRAFARRMGDKFVARVYDCGSAEYWKSCVAQAAKPHVDAATRFETPVKLDLQFMFRRPKSHYRTGKHAGELREDAPRWHTQTPDFDNLAKAVTDALVRIGLIKDDGLVCDCRVTKEYAGVAVGCDITIEEK